jgi:hypothetical protein
MGRPPLSLGCHGSFRTYPEGDHFRSRCKVRDYRRQRCVGLGRAAARPSGPQCQPGRHQRDRDLVGMSTSSVDSDVWRTEQGALHAVFRVYHPRRRIMRSSCHVTGGGYARFPIVG